MCVLYSSNTVAIATISYNVGSYRLPMTVLTYRGRQYDTVEHQKEVLEWQKTHQEAGHRCVYRGVEIDPRYSRENSTLK
jgi:hypothetical protein